MEKRAIKEISDFIFIDDKPKEADIIFIPGSSKWEVSEKAADLYKKGVSQCIVVSGKCSPKLGCFANNRVEGSKYDEKYDYEYEFCKYVLTVNGVNKDSVICETESTNTYENALFSKTVLQENNLNISKAILCCQAFHARRALMTYSYVFPDVEILVAPANTLDITKENWSLEPIKIKRVMGELEKIGKYFSGHYSANLSD